MTEFYKIMPEKYVFPILARAPAPVSYSYIPDWLLAACMMASNLSPGRSLLASVPCSETLHAGSRAASKNTHLRYTTMAMDIVYTTVYISISIYFVQKHMVTI